MGISILVTYGTRAYSFSNEKVSVFSLRIPWGSSEFPCYRVWRHAPNFTIALGAWSWLQGYIFCTLWDSTSMPCPVSFDLYAYRTVAKCSLKRVSPRLADRVCKLHGDVDVHLETILLAEQQLLLQYKIWKKFKDTFRADAVRLNQRIHVMLWLFAQWHQPKVDINNEDTLSSRFVPIPKS